MNIVAFNIDTDELEKTYLTQSITANTYTLPVQSSAGFSTVVRLLVGEMGTEKAEIVTYSDTPDNTSIHLSTSLLFDHSVDEPVYFLPFDTVKFFRSTTGEDGNYAFLSSVSMNVASPDRTTIYDDTTALSNYYYKVQFTHSISGTVSDLSDPIPASGYSYKSVGRIIGDFYEENPNAEDTVSVKTILSWMNTVNDDLESRTRRPYDCVRTREAYSRTANSYTLDYPTFSDGRLKMWKFDFLEYNYTDSTTTPVTDISYPVRMIELEEFQYRHQDNTIDSTTVDDYLQEAALDENLQVIRYYPPSETTRAATFYVNYWKYFDRFDSDSDEVETPSPKLYEDYIRGRYYRLLGKKEDSYLAISDRYMNDYNLEVTKLPKANRRDSGSPRSFGYWGGSTYKGFRR